ncbi:MAG: hypothetical protein U9N86_07565 [Bacteroidota bacterium]|nr:hypothetical protein [Bacteroidota bacterium]
MTAQLLTKNDAKLPLSPVIGVFATGDPRIDASSLERAKNIVKLTADRLVGKVVLPDSSKVEVVYSDILVDSEKKADQLARMFKSQGVNVLVVVPDTWAFPQLTLISLLSHFPKDTPVNFHK